MFTPLQRHELRNAIRLAVFRGRVNDAVAQTSLGFVDRDVAAGSLVETPLNWIVAIDEAERIGAAHASMNGIRSLDLLHIGAALSLGVKELLTFDLRQRIAASSGGLSVIP